MNDGKSTQSSGALSKRGTGVLVHGNLIAERRKSLGLNQIQFANIAKVSDAVIKEIESDSQKLVRPSVLKKIADALGIDSPSLVRTSKPPCLIYGYGEIKKINIQIVKNAQEFLYATGSRSRDTDYLDAIEAAIKDRPLLKHYRILFGLPFRKRFKDHLSTLLKTREGQESGFERLAIAVYRNISVYPIEAAVCLNESMALLVLPSIGGAWEYDTAIVFEDSAVINGWKTWVEGMYRNPTKKIENDADIDLATLFEK